MRVASIDIGTNTTLLLIADVTKEGGVHPVREEHRLPRLGKDVDKDKVIGKAAFESMVALLAEYKGIINRYQVDKTVACGTSAIRDASNREEFIEHIRRATGIKIEVISGKEEALWTYRGALSGLPIETRDAAVLDIGGGSTEISFGVAKDPSAPNVITLNRFSFQIGSVRLTERAFKHLPPKPEEVEAAREIIQGELAPLIQWNVFGHELVGVAGTVTTLACLNQGLMDFRSDKVNGYRLKRDRIEMWLNKFLRLTPGEISFLSHAAEGRADILPAGTLILNEFMKRYTFESIVVSDRGLRYGMALRTAENQ